MRTLNVSEEGFLKFLAIKAGRLQDTSRAATFDHILHIYEEKISKPEKGILPFKQISHITDADKVKNEFSLLKGWRCDL